MKIELEEKNTPQRNIRGKKYFLKWEGKKVRISFTPDGKIKILPTLERIREIENISKALPLSEMKKQYPIFEAAETALKIIPETEGYMKK